MAPVNVVTYHKCINGKIWYIYGKLLHLYKYKAPVNVVTCHKCINGEYNWYNYGILLHLYKYKAPVNVVTYHKCINGKVTTYMELLPISADINQISNKDLCQNRQSHGWNTHQCYVVTWKVTTFMTSCYIYGNLLHLQKYMAPVNVVTSHKYINGQK